MVFHLADLLNHCHLKMIQVVAFWINIFKIHLFFINSKKGIGIFIFWISFSKLKEEEGFKISLVLGKVFLIRTCGL
jgi:hypothetical protein